MEIIRKTDNCVMYDSVGISQINGLAQPDCRELQVIINSADGEIRISMDTSEASALMHMIGNCIDATWSSWSMDDQVFTAKSFMR
jgi:hypothetical protein